MGGEGGLEAAIPPPVRGCASRISPRLRRIKSSPLHTTMPISRCLARIDTLGLGGGGAGGEGGGIYSVGCADKLRTRWRAARSAPLPLFREDALN